MSEGFQLRLPPASSIERSRLKASPASAGLMRNSFLSWLSTISLAMRGVSALSTAARAADGDLPLTSTPPIVALAGMRAPVRK